MCDQDSAYWPTFPQKPPSSTRLGAKDRKRKKDSTRMTLCKNEFSEFHSYNNLHWKVGTGRSHSSVFRLLPVQTNLSCSTRSL